MEHDPYKVLAGLGPDNSVVGLVRPQALKKIQGNLAADEYRVYSIEQDLKNGEGLYEPVVVAYDPKTGYAVVAEGNHRVQAAIEAGEEFIPVVVRTNEVSKKKKGEFTPGKVEKTSGNFYSPDVEKGETREVNPYFVFPDSDILTPEEDGFDQKAGVLLPEKTPREIYVGDWDRPSGFNEKFEEMAASDKEFGEFLAEFKKKYPEVANSIVDLAVDPNSTQEDIDRAAADARSLIDAFMKTDYQEGPPPLRFFDRFGDEFKTLTPEDNKKRAERAGRRTKHSDSTGPDAEYSKNYNPNLADYKSKDGSAVQYVRTDALVGAEGNEIREQDTVDKIAKDLEDGIGFKEPLIVVVDFNSGKAYVTEGNHRLAAARKAGIEFIPIRIVDAQDSEGNVAQLRKLGKYVSTREQLDKLDDKDLQAILPSDIFPESDLLPDASKTLAQDAKPEQNNASAPNLDRMLSILDKYRTKPAEGSSSPAPAVPEGTPGSKANPLKLSTEEFTAKQAQVSDNNKTASQGVLAFVKEQLSRKNLSSWVQGYSRNKTRPLPVNPASDTHYRGANLVALEQAAEENGFSDPRWMTATQVARAGGSIPAGTKGTKILVPTQLVTEVDGEIREIYEFKSVTVFNGDQIDGLAPYDSDSKKSYTAQEAVDIVLDRLREAADARGGSTPEIFGVQLGTNQNPRWMPNYSGVEKLRLPLRANFKNDEAWFQALAHELIHSTGSKDRLDRPELKTGLDRDADITDRSDSIAKEELTAELGSMILARMFGLGIDEENSARYLNFHINDRKLSEKDINDAFSRAQLAVDHLLGNDVLPEWNPESTKVPPTPQSVRMIASTPEGSSLNPDTNPDTVDAPAMGFDQATKKSYGASKSVGSSKDAKERVLAGLLEKIKEGKAPWRKPFKDDANLAGAFVPRNPASKHIYTGINSLVLKLSQQIGGYSDPRWMTYNQAQELGGQVRKGEKGVQILVPFRNSRKEKDSATGEEKVTGSYVTFSSKAVFNVEQIDGLNLPSVKDEAGEPKTPLEAQDFILDRYQKSMEAKGLKAPKVTYTYVGDYGSHSSSPNWSPSADVITLPTQEQFNSPEDMFDTIAHELAHSTGHKDRLDRTDALKNYGTDNAARGKEELIAEISSAILASMFGVNSDFDNTAAYVQSWLEALQNNPEMVMSASSDAQKVVDYLLGMDLGDWSPIEGYKSSIKSKSDGDSNE